MINKLMLVGRLGQDPEEVTFKNGNSIAKTSIATDENYKDKNGEWQTVPEWTDLEVGGTQVERFMQLQKGDLIFVEGTKRTDKVDDKYYTKCRVNYFRIIVKNEGGPTEPAKKKAEDKFDDIPF
jgi:single-strand DNA-binding protein